MKITQANFLIVTIVLFAGASSTAVTGLSHLEAFGPAGLADSSHVDVTNPRGQSEALAGEFTSALDSSETPTAAVGRKGLLAGCTVGPKHEPSCPIPAGWSPVLSDGFEGGKLANSGDEQLHAAQIECTFAHSGSCAVGANYFSNGNSFRWILQPGVIGSSHEIYVSWWEYLESTATINWEMFLVNAIQNTAKNPQQVILDWFGSPDNCANGTGPRNTYNCLNGQILIEPGSNASGGVNAAYYQGYLNANLGTWRQYEYRFIANTPGRRDGQAQLYVDGRLFGSWSNKNFNGRSNMEGMEIDIGGVYTAGAKVDNATRPTVCYPYGSGRGVVRWCSPFSNCAPCPIPPKFHRYWDDIIVLKK